jgi:hypothetical protein
MSLKEAPPVESIGEPKKPWRKRRTIILSKLKPIAVGADMMMKMTSVMR